MKVDEQGKPLGAGEVVVVAAMQKLGADGVTNVTIRGVTDERDAVPARGARRGRPRRRSPGADEVMIGSRIRGRFEGLDLGQTLRAQEEPAGQGGRASSRPAARRTSRRSGSTSRLVRQAFGREGIVSSVRVQLESPTKFDAFRAGVENDKRLGLQAVRETTFYEKQSEGTAMFVGVLGTSVSVFFAVGAMIGAMITMYGAVANRQREIGTLRALGFSRSSVLASFLLEAVILSVIGGAVGAAASLADGLRALLDGQPWRAGRRSSSPSTRRLAS